MSLWKRYENRANNRSYRTGWQLLVLVSDRDGINETNILYISDLNGIRAIAAIVLLLGHASQTLFASWSDDATISLVQD